MAIKKNVLCILALICFFMSSTCFSQNLLKFTLKGKIANAVDSTAIAGAVLMDLNKVDGIATNQDGFFEIDVTENDTLFISSIGYEAIKLKVTRDLSKVTALNIDLFPKIEDLPEIQIQRYKIIGVLEIDVKNVPKDKYNRIHVNGLSQTYESGKNTSAISKLKNSTKTLQNPAQLTFNLFNSKPKKLKKLTKLKEKDTTREILKNRFDREIILDYLEMDLNKLTQVLTDCNYSAYFIKKATDLQLIEAVLECYGNRKAIDKGNTSKNN